MTRPAAIYRRFAASTRGIAAVEFALVASIMFVFLLGTFDAARGIAVYMKVRAATYTLDSIANQYVAIQNTDMQQIFKATAKVLYPYPPAVVISELTVGPAGSGTATVNWSDQLNSVARPQGSTVTLPADMGAMAPGATLILGEVSYVYTPLFGYFAAGGITLSDSLYVTPRSAPAIPRIRN
jgi:Flp pilus assembly protein TadG